MKRPSRKWKPSGGLLCEWKSRAFLLLQVFQKKSLRKDSYFPAPRLRLALQIQEPRLRAQRKDYGQFIEDDGGIFDKHGVRKIPFGGKGDNARAQFFEKSFIRVMLLLSLCQIDPLAINERKLTIDDGRADGTRYGGEHLECKSLHENRER